MKLCTFALPTPLGQVQRAGIAHGNRIIDAAAARIALPVKQLERPEQLNTELKAIDPNLKKTLFKPMNIGDLQSQGKNRPRILPPELVHEIIEQYAKATMLQSAAVQAVPAEAAVPAPLEPQPSPEERIMALANEVVLPAAPPAEGKELSPEEVAKLLNE